MKTPEQPFWPLSTNRQEEPAIKRKRKKELNLLPKILLFTLVVLLCALNALLAPETTEEIPKSTAPVSGNGLTVHFIDVGQADCALLECDGQAMLIDGGNVDDSQLVVSYLNQMGIETLNSVVCTHAHEDHVGGLPGVLSKFPVETVYSPVTEYASKVFGDFVKKTEAQGLSLTIPQPGDQLTLGSATVTVLGPVKEYEETNNTSIVLKVSYGDSDFLFTGDMESDAERDMLDYWGDDGWDVEVLKVGHHGSDTSTGYRLLYETDPDYGVISVETGNSYGHPHKEPLARLRDAGVIVLRTDELGHIIARTDGRDITFTWENQNARPDDVEPGEGTLFYGNKKSKKFHDSGCKNLPSENNRVEFANYGEAVAQGYDPCSSCIH